MPPETTTNDPQDLATALETLRRLDRGITEQTHAIRHIEYWREVHTQERDRIDMLARRILRQNGCPDGAVIDGPDDTRWLVVNQKLVMQPRVMATVVATVPVAEAVVDWPAASAGAEEAEFGPQAELEEANGCGYHTNIPTGRREETREVAPC